MVLFHKPVGLLGIDLILHITELFDYFAVPVHTVVHRKNGAYLIDNSAVFHQCEAPNYCMGAGPYASHSFPNLIIQATLGDTCPLTKISNRPLASVLCDHFLPFG